MKIIQNFGQVALKFKDAIAQYKKERDLIHQQMVDVENMSGEYSNLGQFHRKLFADMLKVRNVLEISFLNVASPELITKFLAQRACELRK